MNHLPSSRSSKFPPLTIPFLCDEFGYQYSHCPLGWEAFEKFPHSYGFNIEDLLTQAVRSRRHAAFLQSWFFFGLLRETFSRPNYQYKPTDFLCPSQSGQVITTASLSRYMWFWQAARVHDDADAMRSLEITIDKCLGLVHRALGNIDRDMRAVGNYSPRGVEWSDQVRVLFSIVLLGDYVSAARQNMRHFSRGAELQWQFAPLELAMKDAGWCVGELMAMSKRCNLSSRCYLAGIDRICLGKDHSSCTAEVGCLAYQLNYHTYRTSHHWECHDQNCKETGPLVKDIVSAIRNGGIAVIDGSNVMEGSQPCIQQVGGACGGATRFVAISHVWSDGLGNPHRNCLCACQLRRIQKLVNSLYPPNQTPVPFWIDSLGIPVGKLYVKDRQVAIARIGETFSKADKVLVLDNSVQRCDGDLDLTEILMRIQYSPWMTRVWTFLEGNIAKNLDIQLGNQAMSSESLRHPRSRKAPEVVSQLLKGLPEEQLWTCPSAMQLIRALATKRPDERIKRYAEMAEQSDEEQEDLRRSALEILEGNKSSYQIGEEWYQQMKLRGLPIEETDEDSHLESDITSQKPCPVFTHALSSIASVRGGASQGGHYFRNPGNRKLSISFGEVCVGLRSRTTSRLEDEAVCIGGILGLDLKDIVGVPSMNWRWRELLDLVDCQRSTIPILRRLGINTRRLTERCHLRRMELLLSQITQLPLSIVFWNISRLPTRSWAPRSLLDREVRVRASDVVGFAQRSDNGRGLEFKMAGFKLKGLQGYHSSSNGTPVHTQHTRESRPDVRGHLIKRPWYSPYTLWNLTSWIKRLVHRLCSLRIFYTRIESDANPEVMNIRAGDEWYRDPAERWLHVEFVPNDKTIASPREARRGWKSYFQSSSTDEYAIIHRGGSGILVRVLSVENNIHMVEHVRLVKPAQSGRSGLEVVGVWSYEEIWCIL